VKNTGLKRLKDNFFCYSSNIHKTMELVGEINARKSTKNMQNYNKIQREN
jgi:hypothetical protein